MSLTQEHIWALHSRHAIISADVPHYWLVNSVAYKRFKNHFRKLLKAMRPRRRKRSVHRAWRKFYQQRQGEQ